MPENHAEYFSKLYRSFKHPDFRATLLTYFINNDVSKDYDFEHSLPKTELKDATINLYKSPFEDFITAHYESFVAGWQTADCLSTALDELNNEGAKYSKKLLELEFIKYCGKAKQIRRNGAKPYCYQLLSNYTSRFRPKQTDEDQDCI
jgi:hypothetical protein